jgi:DNA-binding response OmpR family regulator
MRVLIADEEPTSRSMLTAILEKQGYEVIEAFDGTTALQALQQDDPPRLAIIDWLMPMMDGLEVIRSIRRSQATHSPYLIMLTSMDAKDNIIAGLNAGANDYLTKPFNPDEQRARINVGKRLVNSLKARCNLLPRYRN